MRARHGGSYLKRSADGHSGRAHCLSRPGRPAPGEQRGFPAVRPARATPAKSIPTQPAPHKDQLAPSPTESADRAAGPAYCPKRQNRIFEDRPSQRAAALRGLGDTYRYQGRLAEAIDTFSAALAVFREVADTRSVAGVLNGVADAYRGLSRWYEARCAFETCCFAGNFPVWVSEDRLYQKPMASGH
jgi:hypothetical protein